MFWLSKNLMYDFKRKYYTQSHTTHIEYYLLTTKNSNTFITHISQIYFLITYNTHFPYHTILTAVRGVRIIHHIFIFLQKIHIHTHRLLTTHTHPYYIGINQLLRENARVWYDWSYIVAWCGVGLALLSAILFSSSAICLRGEREREEALNMQYLMPGKSALHYKHSS